MKTELEKQRAENDQLKKQLSHLKEFFSYNISFHERGLLSAIQGCAEIYLSEDENPPLDANEKQQLVERIHSSALRLGFIQSMTRDMAYAGIIQESFRVVSLSNLITELLEKSYPRVGSFIEDNKATLESRIQPDNENCGVRVDIEGLDVGLRRICQSLVKLNSNQPFKIEIWCESNQLIIELRADLPKDKGSFLSEWLKRYQNEWIDPVSKAIFELFDGVLATETSQDQVRCSLKLQIIDMGGAE